MIEPENAMERKERNVNSERVKRKRDKEAEGVSSVDMQYRFRGYVRTE